MAQLLLTQLINAPIDKVWPLSSDINRQSSYLSTRLPENEESSPCPAAPPIASDGEK